MSTGFVRQRETADIWPQRWGRSQAKRRLLRSIWFIFQVRLVEEIVYLAWYLFILFITDFFVSIWVKYSAHTSIKPMMTFLLNLAWYHIIVYGIDWVDFSGVSFYCRCCILLCVFPASLVTLVLALEAHSSSMRGKYQGVATLHWIWMSRWKSCMLEIL